MARLAFGAKCGRSGQSAGSRRRASARCRQRRQRRRAQTEGGAAEEMAARQGLNVFVHRVHGDYLAFRVILLASRSTL